MFIEYYIFLFALHTCKFCKIASINFVRVVYTKNDNNNLETATSLIKLKVANYYARESNQNFTVHGNTQDTQNDTTSGLSP